MPSLRGAIELRVRPIDLPISLRSVARRIGLTDTPLRGEQILRLPLRPSCEKFGNS